MADLKGRRLIFVTGAGLFAVASLVCAIAPSVDVLIAGRVAAGGAAAFLVPASLAIIRVIWPDPIERGHALGIWTSCNGLAIVIGPPLGGALIQHFGWPSIFILMTAISIATFLLAVFTVPESADPADRHFDAKAQVGGALSLASLAFAAIEIRVSPASSSAAVVVAVAAFWYFLSIERKRGAAALIPLDMFRSVPFRGALLAAASMTFGMFAMFFLLPQSWQQTGQTDTATAGLLLLPMAVPLLVLSSLSGAFAQRWGAARVIGGGVVTIGFGLVAIALSASVGSFWPAEVGLILAGVGMGFAAGPMAGVAIGAVGRERSGTAAALNNVARMVGATMGVAVLGSLYAHVGVGRAGLQVALGFGGVVQILGGASSWWLIKARK